MLKHTIQLVDLPSDIGGIALNLMQPKNSNISDAMAVVTITHSQMIKIMPNVEYYGELPKSSSFSLFTVDPPVDRQVYIEYSSCLGYI